MATEGHLSTLCNLLWCEKAQLNGGLADIFALSLIGSMFNGGGLGGSASSVGYLKETLEDGVQATEIENKAE